MNIWEQFESKPLDERIDILCQFSRTYIRLHIQSRVNWALQDMAKYAQGVRSPRTQDGASHNGS